MIRRTITMIPELNQHIMQRARLNRRSISQEISYLIEVALATEADVNLEFVRSVFLAQGGLAGIRDKEASSGDELPGADLGTAQGSKGGPVGDGEPAKND